MKSEYTKEMLEIIEDIHVKGDDLYLIEMKGETLPELIESFIWLYHIEDKTCDLVTYVRQHLQKEIEWLRSIV